MSKPSTSTHKQHQPPTQLVDKLTQKQNQNNILKKQVQQLKSSVLIKDKKILMLSQTISEMTAQSLKIRQQSKNLQILIKNYNKNLYNKNLELNTVQNQAKNKMENKLQQFRTQIDQFKYIIKEQQKQINQLMDDHAMMINTFTNYVSMQEHRSQQMIVLKQFNQELMRQVQEVENVNQRVLGELQATRNQLDLQNRQSQDLMCQVQVMVDHIESTA